MLRTLPSLASRATRSAVAAAVLAGIASVPAARATPTTALVTDDLVAKIRSFLADEVVTISVGNHNDRYGKLSQEEIDRLDQQWVAERKAAKKPLISATLANPLSNYLSRVQALSYGVFTEIIVFDQNGLNVGQSNITSDFWQGDEAKYQRTFLVGPDALFIDEPEFEDETRQWRVQVNVSIPDPARPASVIGAATFELNLTELERRQSQ